ncbi:glycosyltransferase family 4 protein [Patulibacter minatonensis]|uniref:glycosyltransferase family 4 protein n=1 Tax=Patulibacter minatonensis TaxID=298163 RepID=UPI0004B3DEA3|nr:glycosyltransferase family 1 protein [Patulibacter minatonensis]
MKVLLDVRGAGDVRGIGRYVRCLLDGLRATAGPDDEVAEVQGGRGRSDAGVFHSPWLDGALLRAGRPQVITLHDVVPLKRRREYLRTGFRFRLRYLAVQHADRVIVPTQAVADDVTTHLDIPEDRIRVVHEAAAPHLGPADPAAVAAVRERLDLPEDFVVWVGGMRHPDPRKRLPELAAAPRELPLVLVGPAGPWANDLPDVQLTGEVSDDDLCAIYSAARALVLPSDDEGFGLTPVEALRCGCPVACSDVPALREVLGDRAAFAPHDDVAALLAAAEALARPAPAAPPWTWEDAGRATWDVYRELV